MSYRPIGVFDSGVGGLYVLHACRDLLPHEKFIYLADSARMPYGQRSVSEIRAAALDCAEILIGMNCKAIVVACNTATENAIDDIRRLFPSVIVIGLEPAVKPCLRELGSCYAIAIVTEATSRSPRFARLIENAKNVRVLPQPELARLIEGARSAAELKDYIYEMLDPYKDAESVILGCSHYAFVAGLIREFYGGNIKLYDGARGAAERLACRLKESDALASDGEGSIRFYETFMMSANSRGSDIIPQ